MDDFKLFSLRLPEDLANEIDKRRNMKNMELGPDKVWSRNKFIMKILREYIQDNPIEFEGGGQQVASEE